jgi:hypothetical protein
MKNRTLTSGTELYLLLSREFKRRQLKKCRVCYTQFPYRVDRRDDASANWELVLPPDCGGECRAIMEELVAEFSDRYDLAPDATDGKPQRS